MTPKPQSVLAGAFFRQSSFVIFFIVSLLISLSPAFAQKQGVVEGRVINGTDPAIIARGVPLEVIGLGGRMSIIASATTDSEGRFRIESLPASESLIIRANYQGANYHGQAKFDASGTAHVEIKVFETTDSMENIHPEGFRMTFQMVGDQLRAKEESPLRVRQCPWFNRLWRVRTAKAITAFIPFVPGPRLSKSCRYCHMPTGAMYSGKGSIGTSIPWT
jgi:hypothetical protein